jgi:hypothetical protein
MARNSTSTILPFDHFAFLKERILMFFGPVVCGRWLDLIGDEAMKPKEE